MIMDTAEERHAEFLTKFSDYSSLASAVNGGAISIILIMYSLIVLKLMVTFITSLSFIYGSLLLVEMFGIVSINIYIIHLPIHYFMFLGECKASIM